MRHTMHHFWRNSEIPSKTRGVVCVVFDSCRTMLKFTTHMLPRQKTGPVALTFFLTLRTPPTWHHLFPTMKSFLKGKRFSGDESLISEVNACLQAQPAEFYNRGLQNRIKQWGKCISLAEAYVDKYWYLFQDLLKRSLGLGSLSKFIPITRFPNAHFFIILMNVLMTRFAYIY